MPLKLAPLPYAEDALAPHISAKTLQFHHGKHHKAYVDTTNKLIAGTPLADKGLVEIIRAARADDNEKLFNNAAQVWNHDFLWQSMTPKAGKPGGALGAAIDRDFGGVDAFNEAFATTAKEVFGTGWAWLVATGGKLRVIGTTDADTPLVHSGQKPLLTLDVWEHAYYLDYQNARPDYIAAFLKSLINWEFAAANYAAD